MSFLRIRTPDGRNLDRDLGESGYAPRGHHFMMLGEVGSASLRERNTMHQAKHRAANREAINERKRKARCGVVMPTFGDACVRPSGHGTKHRSVLWDRHGSESRDV